MKLTNKAPIIALVVLSLVCIACAVQILRTRRPDAPAAPPQKPAPTQPAPQAHPHAPTGTIPDVDVAALVEAEDEVADAHRVVRRELRTWEKTSKAAARAKAAREARDAVVARIAKLAGADARCYQGAVTDSEGCKGKVWSVPGVGR